MISLSSAEINAWIVAYFFPLARILALLAAAPPFSNNALPVRTRLIIGLLIAVAITPVLPKMPEVEPASGIGLWILAQQLLIGFSMGFVMRVVFSAIDMAGNLISMQMGLGFATAYDPMNSAQTPVVSEIMGLVALILFMSINGHLMLIAALTSSFTTIPVSAAALGSGTWLNLANFGSIVFSTGLLISLPIVTALLITNIAVGVLARAAPQINLFAVGFGITVSVGIILLAVGLTYLNAPLQQLFDHGLQSTHTLFVPAGR